MNLTFIIPTRVNKNGAILVPLQINELDMKKETLYPVKRKRWIKLGKIASMTSSVPYVVDGVKFATDPKTNETWAYIAHGDQ